MSRTTTANYNTEAAKRSKKPVWIIKISGVATFFCTETFGDIDANYKKYMRTVRYSGPKINIDLNTFEWGSLTCEILDKGNTFTNLLDDPIAINNTKVELYHGYQALDFADFSQFPDMYIYKLSLSNDYLVYRIHARSMGYSLFEQALFRKIETTALDADVVFNAVTMSVQLTDNFLGVTDVANRNAFILVNNQEVAKYETKDDANDDFEDMTRNIETAGAPGNSPPHNDGAQVRQAYAIRETSSLDNNDSSFDTPMWALLSLLTTTAAGTNGNFDLGIPDYGLAIDKDLINWQNIHRLGIEHLLGMDRPQTINYRFWLNKIESQDTQKWLEDYFLKPLNAFFYINDDGLLDVKVIDPLAYVSESKTLNNDKIMSITNIELRYDLIVNQLKYYRGRPIERTFIEDYSYKNSSSITAYGESPIKHITDYFVWAAGETTDALEQYHFRKIFGAMGNPPMIATFKVEDSKNAFSPGDWIDVTSTLLPDWINGGRGIVSIPFLILEQWFENYECFYKMVSFDVFNGVDAYTINKVTGGDIDDQLMTLEADHAENNQTVNDAVDTNGTSYSAELLRIRYDITPPGGAAGWKYINLEIKLQTATGTDLFTRDIKIHYDPSWTAEFTVWVYVYWAAGALTFSDVRTDYYATDAAGGDAIGANNVKMTDVWYITENFVVAAL